MDVSLRSAIGADKTIQIMTDHFQLSDERAKRAGDDVRSRPSYDFINQRRSSRNEAVTNYNKFQRATSCVQKYREF